MKSAEGGRVLSFCAFLFCSVLAQPGPLLPCLVPPCKEETEGRMKWTGVSSGNLPCVVASDGFVLC